MNSVNLFLNILQSAVRLLSGVGVSDTVVQQITGIVQFAGALVKEGTTGFEQLKEVEAEIRKLVDEGRTPTPAEWEAWDQRLRAVDERFARIKAGLSEPPVSE